MKKERNWKEPLTNFGVIFGINHVIYTIITLYMWFTPVQVSPYSKRYLSLFEVIQTQWEWLTSLKIF